MLKKEALAHCELDGPAASRALDAISSHATKNCPEINYLPTNYIFTHGCQSTTAGERTGVVSGI